MTKEVWNEEVERLFENDGEMGRGFGADGEVCTLEEARERVGKPLFIPEFAEPFFGKACIDELRGVFQQEAITNIDSLVMSGEMGVQEAMDYIVVMEEFRGVVAEAEALAERMAKSIGEKLPYYMANVVERGKINCRGIQKVLGSVSALCYPMLTHSSDGLSFMVMQGMFYMRLMGRLSVQVNDYLNRNHAREKEFIIATYMRKCKKDMASMIEAHSFLQLYSFEEYLRGNLIRLLPLFEENVDEAGLKRMFDSVQELAQFRTVAHKATHRGLAFELSSMDEAGGAMMAWTRLVNLCLVTIHDPADPEGTAWSLNVDRMSGDLLIGCGSVSDVMGKGAANGLKKVVYTLLLEHLGKKREDVKCAPVAPRPVRKAAIPEVPVVEPVMEPVGFPEGEGEKVEEGLAEAGDGFGNADEGVGETREKIVERVLRPLVPPNGRGGLAQRLSAEEVGRLVFDEGDGHYDRYRTSLRRLHEAIGQAGGSDGLLRVLRVDIDKIFGHFKVEWESLIRGLGYDGRIEWLTYDEVKGKMDRSVPLVVPHKLNTHLSEGWKRGQKNVFVIEASSPRLLLSYLRNFRGVEKVAVREGSEA